MSTESGVHLRAVGLALGVILLRDLLLFDVPGDAVMLTEHFYVPYHAWWPLFQVNDGTLLLATVVRALTLVAALLLAAGRAQRAAAMALLVTYGYLFGADQLHYSNNGYLLLLLLACVAWQGDTRVVVAGPRYAPPSYR